MSPALHHAIEVGGVFAFGVFCGLGAFLWLDAYASFGRVRR